MKKTQRSAEVPRWKGAEVKVTREILEKMAACEEELNVFVKAFPKGCVVNPKNIRKAAKLKLSMVWFANNFFTAPALAEYEKVRAFAWAGATLPPYTMALVWAEYKKVAISAWAEYEKVRDVDAIVAGCKVMGWMK